MAWCAQLASGTTVPITFDDTANSLLVSDVPAGSRLVFLNYSTTKLKVCVGEYSAAPSSTLSVNRNQLTVPAATSSTSPGFIVCDEIMIGNNSKCYVRSDSGSPEAISGVVDFMTWIRK